MFCTKFNSKKYDVSLQQFLKTFVSSNFLIFKGFKTFQTWITLLYLFVWLLVPLAKLMSLFAHIFPFVLFCRMRPLKRRGRRQKKVGFFFSLLLFSVHHDTFFSYFVLWKLSKRKIWTRLIESNLHFYVLRRTFFPQNRNFY